MSHPQLAGRVGASDAQAGGRSVLLAVVALAAVLGLLGWRFVPRTAGAEPPLETVTATVKPNPEPPKPELTDDQQFHLGHAEQQLVAAAEQLVSARRLLASVSPALNRNYLDLEKRRIDTAWQACEMAQRAIEQARTDITVATTRKE